MKRLRLTIPIAPVTKKNHSQIILNKKTGKPMLIPSKEYRLYEEAALWALPRQSEPISEEVNVKCLFYMPTRRKCDLANLLEAIDDVLVKAGVLQDDNFSVIAAHDGSRVLFDKENPRTEIYIEKFIH